MKMIIRTAWLFSILFVIHIATSTYGVNVSAKEQPKTLTLGDGTKISTFFPVP